MTSLPEIGGVRNWDYRFNWLRDAGFTVQALMNLDTAEEANGYFDWFMNLCQANDPEAIQPLYGLHAESDLEEENPGTRSRLSRPLLVSARRSSRLRLLGVNYLRGQPSATVSYSFVFLFAKLATADESYHRLLS